MTRRAVVAGAGVAVAATAAGCSGIGASGDRAGGSAGGQQTLGSASDIPVGGGTVFADQAVVVTQPSAGEIHAFSAICTHQGCTVNQVADGTINCPCHGSKFSAIDGSVVQGPAQKPLPKREVIVDSDSLKLAQRRGR